MSELIKVRTHADLQDILKMIKQDDIESICDAVVGMCKDNSTVRNSVGACTLMYTGISFILMHPKCESVIVKSLSMLIWLVSGFSPETINPNNAVYLIKDIPVICSIIDSNSASSNVMKHAIELVYVLLRCNAGCREPIFDSGIIFTIIDVVKHKLVCTDPCFYYCIAALRNVSLLEKSRPVLFQTVLPFLFDVLETTEGLDASNMQHVLPIIVNACIGSCFEEEGLVQRGLEFIVKYGVEHVREETTIVSALTFCRNYVALRCEVTISAEQKRMIWTLLKAVMSDESKPSERSINQIALCILAKDVWSVDQLEYAFTFLLTDHVIEMCRKTPTIESVLKPVMHYGPRCATLLRQSAVIERLYQLTQENPMSMPIVSIVWAILKDVKEGMREESDELVKMMEDRLSQLWKKTASFAVVRELLRTSLED